MLQLTLSADSPTPLVDQIVTAVRTRIDDRILRPGARLPPIRQFAEHHGVSRFTVVEAYDQLVAVGDLQSRRGSGFYVASRAQPARAIGGGSCVIQPGCQGIGRIGCIGQRGLDRLGLAVRAVEDRDLGQARALRDEVGDPARDALRLSLVVVVAPDRRRQHDREEHEDGRERDDPPRDRQGGAGRH